MSDIEQYMPIPPTGGQATAIEQSRAEAEVKAAVLIAKQCPRDMAAAQEAMRFACRQIVLAERAFFSFPRGGETVAGPSVHLARELALIWGNIQHSIVELSRDEAAGRSEILAYAWDMQTNARSAQIFISPHQRDTKRGKRALTDLRDVYENNANAGARRLREAIFAVLPTWFREEAIALCQDTLKQGNGKPLPERIADIIATYERVGVTVGQLKAKTGRDQAKWDEADVAKLDTLYRSVERGEVTRDEAFPPTPVTADEVAGGAS
jgi:hypothetical protein